MTRQLQVSVDWDTTVLTDSELARLVVRLLQREGISAVAMWEAPSLEDELRVLRREMRALIDVLETS